MEETEDEKERLAKIKAKAEALKARFLSVYALPRARFREVLKKALDGMERDCFSSLENASSKADDNNMGNGRHRLTEGEISVFKAKDDRYFLCINPSLSKDIADSGSTAITVRQRREDGSIVLVFGDSGIFPIPASEVERARNGRTSIRICSRGLAMKVANMLWADVERQGTYVFKIDFVKKSKDGKLKMYKIREENEV